MSQSSLGVAVIGAGMAGRAHVAGYRAAQGVVGPEIPDVRLVAVADINEEFARQTARRYGYERAETSWQAVAEADDVDVVSVVVANSLHREVVEGLLAAGKHVLCEKPLAPSVEDAEAMVAAAEAHPEQQAAVGFSYRRNVAIAAVQQQLEAGTIGKAVHYNGHYWCDYGVDANGPMSWRYRGGPGSGALADIGSHLVDSAEFLCGPITSVRGAVLATTVTERALPLGVAVGHAGAALSDRREPVENEDLATFTATFASGATGTFSVSRVAAGLPNSLGFELFATKGAAWVDTARPGEMKIMDFTPAGPVNGYRQVLLGPDHPYIDGGLAMDFPSVNYGQNDLFVWQCRAFLEQCAGVTGGLPPVPPLSHGLRNLRLLRAVTESAENNGADISVA